MNLEFDDHLLTAGGRNLRQEFGPQCGRIMIMRMKMKIMRIMRIMMIIRIIWRRIMSLERRKE